MALDGDTLGKPLLNDKYLRTRNTYGRPTTYLSLTIIDLVKLLGLEGDSEGVICEAFNRGSEVVEGMRATIAFIAAALTLGAHDVHAQTKRALLVGINVYNYSGPLAESWRAKLDPTALTQGSLLNQRREMVNLAAAVSDARTMEQVLRERFQFTATRVLEDSEATRSGILQAIAQLVDQSQPGDIAVFYFAGHGSQETQYERPSTILHQSDGSDDRARGRQCGPVRYSKRRVEQSFHPPAREERSSHIDL